MKMNIYHITYEATHQTLGLHFWGCNLSCRGCFKNYQIYDLGLAGSSAQQLMKAPKAEPPSHYLTVEQVLEKTAALKPKSIFFMGKEAALDLKLPVLAAKLRARHGSFHTLLTNGLRLADLTNIDEVVFGFKATSEAIHKEYTGASNQGIMDNFKAVYDSGKRLQAEIAFIPGLVEDEEILALAKLIAQIDTNILFRVTSYFSVPGAPWPTASKKQVSAVALKAQRYLDNVETITSESRDDQWKPTQVF